MQEIINFFKQEEVTAILNTVWTFLSPVLLTLLLVARTKLKSKVLADSVKDEQINALSENQTVLLETITVLSSMFVEVFITSKGLPDSTKISLGKKTELLESTLKSLPLSKDIRKVIDSTKTVKVADVLKEKEIETKAEAKDELDAIDKLLNGQSQET